MIAANASMSKMPAVTSYLFLPITQDSFLDVQAEITLPGLRKTKVKERTSGQVVRGSLINEKHETTRPDS